METHRLIWLRLLNRTHFKPVFHKSAWIMCLVDKRSQEIVFYNLASFLCKQSSGTSSYHFNFALNCSSHNSSTPKLQSTPSSHEKECASDLLLHLSLLEAPRRLLLAYVHIVESHSTPLRTYTTTCNTCIPPLTDGERRGGRVNRSISLKVTNSNWRIMKSVTGRYDCPIVATLMSWKHII